MTQGVFTMAQQLQGQIRKAWSNSVSPSYVEYLVVAGGGGGGGSFSGQDTPGGGGAGGLLQGVIPITAGSSITVTVGGGGAGASGGGGNGGNGCNSIFGNIKAIGGGGGGGYGNGSTTYLVGQPGGSGGGSGGYNAGYGVPGQGIAGQGNAGGYPGSITYGGNGGGGAGTAGLPGTSANTPIGGNGGAGITSAISGIITAYAGGGGGGVNNSSVSAGIGGSGGVGGGGGSPSGSSGNGSNGTANTGGGGGASSFTSGSVTGGSGGSGIVIISFPDIYNAPASFGGANSPTSSTSGSGSLSLSGSSQYISYTSNAAFACPSDFTLEMWIYPLNWTASGIYPYVTYPGTDGGLMIGKNGSNFVIRAANVADQLTYGTLPTVNAWTHIVAVRSGTTLSMYYNGTRVATTTNSYSFAQALLKIGSDGYGADFPGYISNVRLVKGTAVYSPSSTALTVPTAPLTAISGTSILLNTVSGSQFTDSSTNSFTPTTAGSPSWNQLSPFATGLGYKNRVYTWTASGTVTF